MNDSDRTCNQDPAPSSFEFEFGLEQCLGLYEQGLEARLEAGYGGLDPNVAEQIDEAAWWFSKGVTEGTVDLASTEGWPWDCGYLFQTAAPLMRTVKAFSPDHSSETDPTVAAYLASGAFRSEGLERRPSEDDEVGDGLDGGLCWDGLRDVEARCRSGANPALTLAWERFRITLGPDALDRVRKGAVRTLLLADLVCQMGPSEDTLHQVGLAFRQFVWGFDQECIILCRAVLDNALQKSAVQSPSGQAQQGALAGRYTLEEWSATAEEDSLSDEARDAVHRVEVLANVAIKGRLQGPERALEAMQNTMWALEQIG